MPENVVSSWDEISTPQKQESVVSDWSEIDSPTLKKKEPAALNSANGSQNSTSLNGQSKSASTSSSDKQPVQQSVTYPAYPSPGQIAQGSTTGDNTILPSNVFLSDVAHRTDVVKQKVAKVSEQLKTAKEKKVTPKVDIPQSYNIADQNPYDVVPAGFTNDDYLNMDNHTAIQLADATGDINNVKITDKDKFIDAKIDAPIHSPEWERQVKEKKLSQQLNMAKTLANPDIPLDEKLKLLPDDNSYMKDARDTPLGRKNPLSFIPDEQLYNATPEQLQPIYEKVGKLNDINSQLGKEKDADVHDKYAREQKTYGITTAELISRTYQIKKGLVSKYGQDVFDAVTNGTMPMPPEMQADPDVQKFSDFSTKTNDVIQQTKDLIQKPIYKALVGEQAVVAQNQSAADVMNQIPELSDASNTEYGLSKLQDLGIGIGHVLLGGARLIGGTFGVEDGKPNTLDRWANSFDKFAEKRKEALPIPSNLQRDAYAKYYEIKDGDKTYHVYTDPDNKITTIRDNKDYIIQDKETQSKIQDKFDVLSTHDLLKSKSHDISLHGLGNSVLDGLNYMAPLVAGGIATGGSSAITQLTAEGMIFAAQSYDGAVKQATDLGFDTEEAKKYARKISYLNGALVTMLPINSAVGAITKSPGLLLDALLGKAGGKMLDDAAVKAFIDGKMPFSKLVAPMIKNTAGHILGGTATLSIGMPVAERIAENEANRSIGENLFDTSDPVISKDKIVNDLFLNIGLSILGLKATKDKVSQEMMGKSYQNIFTNKEGFDTELQKRIQEGGLTEEQAKETQTHYDNIAAKLEVLKGDYSEDKTGELAMLMDQKDALTEKKKALGGDKVLSDKIDKSIVQLDAQMHGLLNPQTETIGTATAKEGSGTIAIEETKLANKINQHGIGSLTPEEKDYYDATKDSVNKLIAGISKKPEILVTPPPKIDAVDIPNTDREKLIADKADLQRILDDETHPLHKAIDKEVVQKQIDEINTKLDEKPITDTPIAEPNVDNGSGVQQANKADGAVQPGVEQGVKNTGKGEKKMEQKTGLNDLKSKFEKHLVDENVPMEVAKPNPQEEKIVNLTKAHNNLGRQKVEDKADRTKYKAEIQSMANELGGSVKMRPNGNFDVIDVNGKMRRVKNNLTPEQVAEGKKQRKESKETYEKIAQHPFDEIIDRVKQYFATGGTIHTDDFNRIFKGKDKEKAKRFGWYSGKAPSTDKIVEGIVGMQADPKEYDEARNAIEDVLLRYDTRSDLQGELVDKMDEGDVDSQIHKEHMRQQAAEERAENEIKRHISENQANSLPDIEKIFAEIDAKSAEEIKQYSELFDKFVNPDGSLPGWDEIVRYEAEQRKNNPDRRNERQNNGENAGSGKNNEQQKNPDLPDRSPQKELGSGDEENLRNEITTRLREGTTANTKDRELSAHEREDAERKIAYDFAKEKGVWIDNLYSLGSPHNGGGNENTLALNRDDGFIYKQNNLFNTNHSILQFLDQLDLHNKYFPETAYELIGFTGFENKNQIPFVEPIVRQKFIDNAADASPGDIQKLMESIGFEKISDSKFKNKEVTISDLHPRNVLKDADGTIYVVDDIIKRNPDSSAKDQIRADIEKKKDDIKNKWRNGNKMYAFSDPKREAQAQYDFHKDLVDLAKLYISYGYESVKDWAKDLKLPEKVLQRAWDEAQGGEPVKESVFSNKKNHLSRANVAKAIIDAPEITEKVTPEVRNENQPGIDEPNNIGIKRKITDKRREEIGLPPIELPKLQSNDAGMNLAKDAVDSGVISPNEIEAELISHVDSPKNAKASQNDVFVLQYHRLQLENKEKELIETKLNIEEQLKSNPDDAGMVGQLLLIEEHLKNNKSDMDRNTTASRVVSNIFAGLGHGLQTELNNEGEVQQLINSVRDSYGDNIPADVKERLDKLEQENKELHIKNETIQKKFDEVDQAELDKKLQDAVKDAYEKGKKDGTAGSEKKKYATRTKKAADQFRKIFKSKPIVLKDANGNEIKLTQNTIIAWNDIVEIGAKAIELTGEIADGIKAIVDHIKDEDWYKTLSPNDKKAVESQLTDHLTPTVASNDKLKVPSSRVKELYDEGFKTIDEIVTELNKEYPESTPRDVRDAITGYGKTSELSQDPDDAAIRKLKRLGRYISAIEDIEAGVRPSKTGQKRDVLDAQEREQLKIIREGLKKMPLTAADLDAKLKTAQDAIETRLRNSIEDLQRQIDTGQKPIRNSKIETTKEIEALKEERDRLKEIRDDKFAANKYTDTLSEIQDIASKESATTISKSMVDNGLIRELIQAHIEKGTPVEDATKEALSDLQKIMPDVTDRQFRDAFLKQGEFGSEKKTLPDLQKQLAELRKEARIQTKIEDIQKGIVAERKVRGESSPKVQAMQKQLAELRKEALNKYPDLSAADLKRKAEAVQRQIDKGDYIKLPVKRVKFQDNPEWVKNDKRLTDIKVELNKLKEVAYENNKNGFMKALDILDKWLIRSVFFGSYAYQLKLAASAVSSIIHKPIEDILGGLIYNSAFKNIARKAPIEGNTARSTKALKTYYAEIVKVNKWMKAIKELTVSGKTALDNANDKYRHVNFSLKFKGKTAGEIVRQTIGADHIPLVDLLTTDPHAMIKEPIKRATYESAFNTYMGWVETNMGADAVSDPLIIEVGKNVAFLKAKSEIYMGNAVTESGGVERQGFIDSLGNKISAIRNEAIKNAQSENTAERNKANIDYAKTSLYRFFLPIVRVPSNIISRAIKGNPIVLVGNIIKTNRINKDVSNGFQITNEHADALLRDLKKGSVTSIYWVAGAMLAGSIAGGFWNPFYPDKKRKGVVKSGEIDLGQEKHSWENLMIHGAEHAPQIQAMMLGATFLMTLNHYNEDQDENMAYALAVATAATTNATLDQHPVYNTVADIFGAAKSEGGLKRFGNDIKRRFDFTEKFSKINPIDWYDEKLNHDPKSDKPTGNAFDKHDFKSDFKNKEKDHFKSPFAK